MRTNIDKCFYNPNDKKVLPKHKIEVWPGYVFTVDEYEGGVFLQVGKFKSRIMQFCCIFTNKGVGSLLTNKREYSWIMHQFGVHFYALQYLSSLGRFFFFFFFWKTDVQTLLAF